MNLPYLICYIIVDLTCIGTTAIVAHNLRDDSGSELQVRYFRYLLIFYVAFVVSDALWASLTIGAPSQRTQTHIAVLNGMNKTSVGFLACSWLGYAASYFKSPLVYSKRMRKLVTIPAFLIPVLYVIGHNLGLNTLILPDGSAQNGPMYIAITAIAMTYLLVTTVSATVRFFKEKVRMRRHRYLAFISFMFTPTVAAIFDVVVPNMPVISPAILISILLVMFSMQEARISTDALTGLNNRRAADIHLDERLMHASTNAPLYVFLIDMNKFKAINDTYGHLEGDNALQTMAAALQRTRAEFDAFVARWGGDEFVVICPSVGEDTPAAIKKSIRANLAEEVASRNVHYTLSCGIGHACCDDPSTKPAKLIAEADEALYRDKRHPR